MFLRKPSDENLVKLAQGGDQHAVSLLYRRYAQAIFRYCVYQLGSHETAEDLMQDTFIEMIHSLKRFAFTGSFKNWLYTIAKRQILALLREKYKLPKTELVDWLSSPDNPDWIDQAKQASLREKSITKLLSKLKPHEKQILDLMYLQGHTSKETASVTGRTPESVRVIAHRAIQKLKTTKL